MSDRIDLDHMHRSAWRDRRDGETRAMLATAPSAPAAQGASISTDGRCLRCRGELIPIDRQQHLSRDWCECRFCGTQMPAVIGSAGEVLRG